MILYHQLSCTCAMTWSFSVIASSYRQEDIQRYATNDVMLNNHSSALSAAENKDAYAYELLLQKTLIRLLWPGNEIKRYSGTLFPLELEIMTKKDIWRSNAPFLAIVSLFHMCPTLILLSRQLVTRCILLTRHKSLQCLIIISKLHIVSASQIFHWSIKFLIARFSMRSFYIQVVTGYWEIFCM